MSPSEIEGYINQLDKECNAIRDDILRVTWYMRGGVNYEQAMQLSYEERKLIQKIVKDNNIRHGPFHKSWRGYTVDILDPGPTETYFRLKYADLTN